MFCFLLVPSYHVDVNSDTRGFSPLTMDGSFLEQKEKDGGAEMLKKKEYKRESEGGSDTIPDFPAV